MPQSLGQFTAAKEDWMSSIPSGEQNIVCCKYSGVFRIVINQNLIVLLLEAMENA
jgi:hypothetical protein